jgi:hypothetical protein
VNAFSFWLRVACWAALTVAEIPLQALRRMARPAVADDLHDVFEEDGRDD